MTDETADPPETGASKPPRPAREGVPSPAGAPSHRRRPEGRDRKGEATKPPTPVREVLGREATEAAPVDTPACCELKDGSGRHWRVEVVGRGRSGRGVDPGAPLLLLRFLPLGEVGAGTATAPPEALVLGVSLEALSEKALLEALATAGPPTFAPGEFFGGTRRPPRRK